MENIKLRNAIEFLVFSATPLTLTSSKSSRQSISCVAIDCDESTLTLQITEKSKFADLRYLLDGEKLNVTCGYKHKSLTFETKLIKPCIEEIIKAPYDAEIVFSRPEFGLIEDRRKHKRFKLDRADLILSAKLDVNGPDGRYSIFSNELFDISATGIALYIDRKSGLLMPRDTVVNLEITNHELPIFQSRGHIVRIDRELKSKASDSQYFAVISFDGERSEAEVRDATRERRQADRINLFDQEGVFLEFRHPLFSEKNFRARIVDVSQNGISFVLDKTNYPIVKGMRIFNASLQLPYQSRLECSFRVSFVQSVVDEDKYTIRAGGEFIGVSVELLKGISITKQRLEKSTVVDADSEDYDNLWSFFFETGFIYPSKRKQLQELAPKIMDTYRRLLNEENPILKKILYKDEKEIKGHISAIKFFDHSWIIQHLNALKVSGPSAAQAVLMGISDFFDESRANAKSKSLYANAYYRPDNLYPAIIFGESANLINDPKACSKETLEFCLVKEDVNKLKDDVQIREAVDEDLNCLEELLLHLDKGHLIQLENLTIENATNLKVSKKYEELGLYRYRKVFIAELENQDAIAFAICNFASPGLNLSELTNSFRLVYSSEDDNINCRLGTALAQRVLEEYEKSEMPFPVLLNFPEFPVPSQFSKQKEYVHWWISLMFTRDFVRATNVILKNIKDYLRSKQETKSTPPAERQKNLRMTS